MTVAFVRAHSVFANKSSGTSLDVNRDVGVPAGNVLVLAFVFDNAATASKPVVSSITKQAGETNNWALLGAARSTSTSLGAFASGEMWAIKTTVAWTAAAYVATLDTAVTMKSCVMLEFTGADAVLRSTVGTNYSTTTTAASAATTGTTPVVGDLALGLTFGSNVAAAQAGDTDTLGGSWSAVTGLGSTGGSGTTNNFGIVQYKVLTAASHQTYNNSAAMTAGNGSIVAVLQATPAPAITQAAYRFYADGTETGSTALAAENTAYTADVSSGDLSLLVRMMLQSTNATVVPATDDFTLQWEKNASGTWTTVDAGTSPFVNYPESNESAAYTLGHPTVPADAFHVAIQGNGMRLTRLRLKLRKTGSPTGNLTATVYAHSGTYGSGIPTGSALNTSTTTISIATLTTTTAWVDFYFDGALTLSSGTNYFVGVESDQSPFLSTDNVQCGIDNTAPTYAGNTALRNAGTWTAQTSDGIFEVYTFPGVVPYDSTNLTDGAATTARLTAGSGSFVAGKVSEDGIVDNLGWSGNNYTELLYAITLKAADLANSDTLRFRVVDSNTEPVFTYTQTPTIPVTKSTIPTSIGRYPKLVQALTGSAVQRAITR